jgi:hypothetical protein
VYVTITVITPRQVCIFRDYTTLQIIIEFETTVFHQGFKQWEHVSHRDSSTTGVKHPTLHIFRRSSTFKSDENYNEDITWTIGDQSLQV